MLIPEVRLLPIKIKIEGIIIIKVATPREYLMVFVFFNKCNCLFFSRKRNNDIDASNTDVPAKNIGGKIFVEWVIRIGKRE